MIWSSPSPAELLGAARQALTSTGEWGAVWPRATAFLARQALEDAVGSLWVGPRAGLRNCSMAAQLTCLRFYLDDPELARRTRQCWFGLSRGCHAHPYELAPTAGELATWLAEVEAFLTHLSRPPAA